MPSLYRVQFGTLRVEARQGTRQAHLTYATDPVKRCSLEDPMARPKVRRIKGRTHVYLTERDWLEAHQEGGSTYYTAFLGGVGYACFSPRADQLAIYIERV